MRLCHIWPTFIVRAEDPLKTHSASVLHASCDISLLTSNLSVVFSKERVYFFFLDPPQYGPTFQHFFPVLSILEGTKVSEPADV